MNEKANELLGKARSLPKPQKIGIGAMAGAVVAIPAFFLLLGNDPNYSLLVNGGSEGVSDIVAAFEERQLDFNVQTNGAIWVSAQDRNAANMILARIGYPSYSTTSYDKLLGNDSLYMSQRKEDLLSRQILEENLSSAISSIEQVERAHVRLALSSDSGFLRSASPSSASVVLVLKRGETLSREQIKAIGRLVASGVKNLPLENVNIVDQQGNLLSNFDEDAVSDGRSSDIVSSYERDYDRRAREHFSALYGHGGITVSSSFNVNFDRVRNTTKEPLENAVVLSRQSEKTFDEAMMGAGGVPGATANQPPEHADFEGTPAGGSASGNDSGASHINEIVNYEVGTSITNTEYQVGNVENVSVVAFIDGRLIPEEEQEAVIEETRNVMRLLSPVPELTQVEVVVRQFREAEVPDSTPVAFWKTPQAMSIWEMIIRGLSTAFVALMGYLAVSKLLARKENENKPEAVSGDNDVVEEAPPTYDDLAEQLVSLSKDKPDYVSEAMRSVIHQESKETGAKDVERV